MAPVHIVVHYHELWLKQGNRRFFLHKLREAMHRALDGIALLRITRPSDRFVIELADATQVQQALDRLARVSGIANIGIARAISWRSLGYDHLRKSRPRSRN